MNHIPVSFTFRPLSFLKNLTITVVCVIVLVIPKQVSVASDKVPPPALTAAMIERNANVLLVKKELGPKLTKATPQEINAVSEAIVDECKKTRIDPLFIIAIIEAESNFDIEAVSPTGARGLMQIMPATFKLVSDAKRMFDPVENVRAGIRYIRYLWDQKIQDPWSILLGYNQGPGVVFQVWRKQIPVPEEAEAYIPAVLAKYRHLLVKYGHSAKDIKKLFVANR